jgi:serine/threonine-protein kinase RsbW
MHIGFTVRLPVDVSSVPFVRGLCRSALEHLHVDGEIVDEVTLVLSEACANVVQHAGPLEDYEVRVDIDDERCRISVFDDGGGFDPDAVAARPAGSLLDGGRGLLLMRALADTLHFERDPDGRHCVTFAKQLRVGGPSPVTTGA